MDDPDGTPEEYIKQRAYELWQRAGQPFGQDEHFWRLASDFILAEQAPRTTLRDKLKEYNDVAVRGLKVLDARLGYELYQVEQRVHRGARGDRPPVLWYYTNGNTLARMLASGEIWSTQVSCLNDSQEISHGLGLMRDVLKLQPSGGDYHDTFKAFLMERLTELPKYYMNCFVMCLSANKNDLSQWRGYSGGENGVSVGLDADALLNKIETTRIPRLVKVEYDELENRRKARQLLDVLFMLHGLNNPTAESGLSYSSDVWMASLYEIFQGKVLGWLASMKHPAFRSEQEWRLILHVYELENLNYLEKSTMITRHFPVSFPGLHESYKLLPIREILVGPSRHPDVSRDSIGKMLINYNYPYIGWDIEINMSGIPFQVP